jgi:hypothetical protein
MTKYNNNSEYIHKKEWQSKRTSKRNTSKRRKKRRRRNSAHTPQSDREKKKKRRRFTTLSATYLDRGKVPFALVMPRRSARGVCETLIESEGCQMFSTGSSAVVDLENRDERVLEVSYTEGQREEVWNRAKAEERSQRKAHKQRSRWANKEMHG